MTDKELDEIGDEIEINPRSIGFMLSKNIGVPCEDDEEKLPGQLTDQIDAPPEFLAVIDDLEPIENKEKNEK